jgi:hypothetical protein
MPALEQVRALQGGRIDLGLMLPPVEGAAIISDPVWSEEWLAAFPEVHPLAHRTKLHATAFNGQDIIIGHIDRGPRCGRRVLDMLDMLHVNVRIVAEVEHLQTALMLVQSGAGIAFVPGALAHVSIDGIAFRPFNPAKGRIVVYAVWPDGTTSGLVAQFLRVAHAVTAAADAASVALWHTERRFRCTKLPEQSASNGRATASSLMTPLQRHGALSADRLQIGGMNCIVFWLGILQMSYSLDSVLEIALRMGEAGREVMAR